jgi:hypothetical protein
MIIAIPAPYGISPPGITKGNGRNCRYHHHQVIAITRNPGSIVKTGKTYLSVTISIAIRFTGSYGARITILILVPVDNYISSIPGLENKIAATIFRASGINAVIQVIAIRPS